MNKSQKVVIIGGVAGGATCAARLRRLDEQAEIVMFERGEYISFANCGLPYYIGGEITQKSALTLQTPQSFHARFRVDVRTLSEVISIHTSAKEVEVQDLRTGKTYRESYDKLVLSMGAAPLVPPVEGASTGKVFTLRNIPDTYKIKEYMDSAKPKSAVVIGGGYIGLEMAENLCAAGLHVTVVEMSEQVIAPLDFDMACEVHQYLRGKGVELLLGAQVKAISEVGGGLELTVQRGEATQKITGDFALMSVGVRPETAIAKAAGLELTARGHIVTDGFMCTSNPDIYAVGDAVEVTDFVTGQKAAIPLAGPANKQGRIAADQIARAAKGAEHGAELFLDSAYGGTQGSSVLKLFDMTVGTTGVNEKTAQKLGIAYDKVFLYPASHASYYPSATNMSMKVLFEPSSGKILGAQLVGFDGVDKRCDVLATVIRLGGTAHHLTTLELCYAPPFSSAKDPVNMAGYVIENVRTGKEKSFHWHDVAALARDGSVTLLDTRTKTEYARGHIDGFRNIPLDDLRENLSQLERGKPVYVTCQVGLRGYLAARILAQNGFDTYNLSGGYRLYHTIFGGCGAPPATKAHPCGMEK